MELSWTAQWDDILSPDARTVLKFSPGRAYGRLVPKDGGSEEARAVLNRLTPEGVLARPVVSRQDASALLAGLWLWHDFLDESHAISQNLPTPTGSLWHALLQSA